MRVDIVAASDGSCKGGAKGTGGVGVTISEVESSCDECPALAKESYSVSLNGSHFSDGRCTSNRSELVALGLCMKAVEGRVREHHESGHEVGTVTIWSDSRYAIDSTTTWYGSHQRRGWRTSRGNPVKNGELIRSVRRNYESLKGVAELHILHVAAHTGSKGMNYELNSEADTLAGEGSSRASTFVSADTRSILADLGVNLGP